MRFPQRRRDSRRSCTTPSGKSRPWSWRRNSTSSAVNSEKNVPANIPMIWRYVCQSSAVMYLNRLREVSGLLDRAAFGGALPAAAVPRSSLSPVKATPF